MINPRKMGGSVIRFEPSKWKVASKQYSSSPRYKNPRYKISPIQATFSITQHQYTNAFFFFLPIRELHKGVFVQIGVFELGTLHISCYICTVFVFLLSNDTML